MLLRNQLIILIFILTERKWVGLSGELHIWILYPCKQGYYIGGILIVSEGSLSILFIWSTVYSVHIKLIFRPRARGGISQIVAVVLLIPTFLSLNFPIGWTKIELFVTLPVQIKKILFILSKLIRFFAWSSWNTDHIIAVWEMRLVDVAAILHHHLSRKRYRVDCTVVAWSNRASRAKRFSWLHSWSWVH